jgi:hypothetical protein
VNWRSAAAGILCTGVELYVATGVYANLTLLIC